MLEFISYKQTKFSLVVLALLSLNFYT